MAYDKLVDSAQLDAGLTSVADAIRAKGGTTDAMAFPEGFVSAVEGIQAGGGNVRIETGTVTFAADTTAYNFLDENPDLFIVYSANTEKPEYRNRAGIWMWLRKPSELFVLGYNTGSMKYYAPFYSSSTNLAAQRCKINANDFNSKLLASASPYVWYAIWGVS